MNKPRNMFDKIWDRHVVAQRDDGEALIYVDRNFVHEGPFYAFDKLRLAKRAMRRPLKQIAISDHYLPTLNRAGGLAGIKDPEIRNMVEQLQRNARDFKLPFIGMEDTERQGIMHVVGPDLGLVQPGMVITAADSHTTTNGAFGAFSFGIGASEIKHVMATQALWYRKPKTLRVTIDGKLGAGITAKDVILAIIAKIGISGGNRPRHRIRGRGDARDDDGAAHDGVQHVDRSRRARGPGRARRDDLQIPGRPRVFAAGRAVGRKRSRSGRRLPSDADAKFDKEVALNGADIAPMVTWGTSPDDALPITGRVPDPAQAASKEERVHLERALHYMGLTAGMPISEIKVDRVFIGSCTNARFEDLVAAADVAKGRKVVVPSMISPGSTEVKRRAEAAGLDKIFTAAGFEWRDSACSMCVGSNGDFPAPGESCASTSPRNFENRQGRGVRTHLVSPAMAVAAAVTGKLTDVRTLK